MAKGIARMYQALSAAVVALLGEGGRLLRPGRAVATWRRRAATAPPASRSACGVDSFRLEHHDQGETETRFIGPLHPDQSLVPPAESDTFAEGKVIGQTDQGPETFPIGKFYHQPVGAQFPFLFGGHLIPASSDRQRPNWPSRSRSQARFFPDAPVHR